MVFDEINDLIYFLSLMTIGSVFSPGDSPQKQTCVMKICTQIKDRLMCYHGQFGFSNSNPLVPTTVQIFTDIFALLTL